MFTRVQQYVRNRVADFARVSKRPEVIAPRQYRARSIEDPVYRVGQTRGDGHHFAPHGVIIRGFDDHVHVVVLQRVMHGPKVITLAHLPKTAPKLANETPGAQRGHIVSNAQRNVRRPFGGEDWPLDVMNDRPGDCRPPRVAAHHGRLSCDSRQRKSGRPFPQNLIMATFFLRLRINHITKD
jgi:hypothetical protein